MNKKSFKKILCGIISFLFLSVSTVGQVFADASIALSPMNRVLILTPGEKSTGTFLISNSASNDEDINYEITIIPYFPNQNNETAYDYVDDYNKLVDWISVDHTTGTISPNQTREVHYEIDVPTETPAGGQYAAIKVSSITEDAEDVEGLGASIGVTFGIAYIIYTEIAGTTERSGDITDIEIPGFLFSGNVSGHSTTENTGNVHGKAKYTLQVFPLFSNEEIYTNEENPDTQYILPDRTSYHETVWSETPDIGIFNVIYKAEFEGKTLETKRLVIKCPIWLLFIIIFAIFALIFYFVAKAKSRKKANQKASRS